MGTGTGTGTGTDYTAIIAQLLQLIAGGSTTSVKPN
jgi:hypothetical protein